MPEEEEEEEVPVPDADEQIPDYEEEEIDGVIYPDDAVQHRRRSAPLNYAVLHNPWRRA